MPRLTEAPVRVSSGFLGGRVEHTGWVRQGAFLEEDGHAQDARHGASDGY